MNICKKWEVLMKTTLSPCGIDCKSCDAYIATKNKDQALFEKLVEQYQTNLGKSIECEQLRCDGCKNEGRHIRFCYECEIRICSADKGFETCAECPDFPCAKGQYIWTEVSVSRKNLEKLRRE